MALKDLNLSISGYIYYYYYYHYTVKLFLSDKSG